MAEFATEYKDLLTISFSALSFIVACIALFFSIRTNIRDKEKLRITARTVTEPIYNKVYKIEVTVTNIGRRIAVIEGLQYEYGKNHKFHDYSREGIHLKERERVKLYVERQCITRDGDEGEVYQLEDITVLDTQGREHKIKDSKKLLERLIEG